MQFVDLKQQYKLLKPKISSRIDKVLEHGQYIMGPEVAELEQKLADYIDARHCISVASGTNALLIAMMALEIQPGEEVITTPFSFIATAETIALLGAVPVFVDIDPQTYNISPLKIKNAITSKTRAIMAVSLYGQCADFDAINAIATKHNIPVIEDGAQSFGSTYKERSSCNLTTIGCTSFFPSKPLGGYGDGGACFTNDDVLATRMRNIRVHGQDRRYHHPMIGVNGRLDTLQAAILLAKFEQFPSEVLLRQQVAEYYMKHLPDNVIAPYVESYNTNVFAQFTIRTSERDKLQEHLRSKNIPTAIHYPTPLHKQPAFAGLERRFDLVEAEHASKTVISLPMHPYLSQDQMIAVCDTIAAFGGPVHSH